MFCACLSSSSPFNTNTDIRVVFLFCMIRILCCSSFCSLAMLNNFYLCYLCSQSHMQTISSGGVCQRKFPVETNSTLSHLVTKDILLSDRRLRFSFVHIFLKTAVMMYFVKVCPFKIMIWD